MTDEQKQVVKEKIAIEMLETRHKREIANLKEENQLVLDKLITSIKSQKKEYEIKIENLETDLRFANKRTERWEKAYKHLENNPQLNTKLEHFRKHRHEIIKKSVQDSFAIKNLEDLLDEANNNILLLLKK
jgi:hypothetical protein